MVLSCSLNMLEVHVAPHTEGVGSIQEYKSVVIRCRFMESETLVRDGDRPERSICSTRIRRVSRSRM